METYQIGKDLKSLEQRLELVEIQLRQVITSLQTPTQQEDDKPSR